MTVCVLDVGGGTADITVHDVEERGGRTALAEALHAVGALAGSVYVDTAFRWVPGSLVCWDSACSAYLCCHSTVPCVFSASAQPARLELAQPAQLKLCVMQGVLSAPGGRGCI